MIATPFFAAAFLFQATTDVDDFMQKVLEKRKVNWSDYYDHFCNERAELSLEGSLGGLPLQSYRHEYLWFVRDGYMVRSPVSADGVRISAEERDRAELAWIEFAKRKEAEDGPDRERFFGFVFEPGNYFFAGKTELEGRELVVVEYYPEKAFGDRENDDDPEGSEIDAGLNKSLMVTMLVDPEAHQIVRMTIDNLGFDFLPAGWLVKIDTIEATLTMHQPFAPREDVWLARDIEAHARVKTAAGDLGVRYRTTFYNCVEAETGTTYRFAPRKPR